MRNEFESPTEATIKVGDKVRSRRSFRLFEVTGIDLDPFMIYVKAPEWPSSVRQYPTNYEVVKE